MVRWKTCILRPILVGGRIGDKRRVGFFPALSQIARVKVNVSRVAKDRLSANAVRPFVTFLCPVTFRGLGKKLRTSRALRLGPIQWAARLDGGESPLPLELGARFGLLKQFRVLAHLVACTERVAHSRLELQSWPGRHVRLCSLLQWFVRNSWDRLLLPPVSLSVLGSRREVDGSHPTKAAHAAWRWLRCRQHSASVSGWEVCGGFSRSYQ